MLKTGILKVFASIEDGAVHRPFRRVNLHLPVSGKRKRSKIRAAITGDTNY